ncbi:MAG: substrate-binding domain-containing protein [Pseudomonadota bacterium]
MLRPGGFLGLERFDRIRPSIYAGWSGDLRARLGRGDLEAAITIDADGREVATNAIHVGHARLQVVGRRQAAGSEIDIATANASGWALNPAGCGYRDVLSEALERLGLSLNIGLETNSTETQIAVAGSGRLYSLAPSVVDSVLLASAGADLLCCPEIDVGLNFQVTPAAHTGRMGVLDAVANAAARLLTK